MERDFTIPDVWIGGDYELDLDFGLSTEAVLRRALSVLWSASSLSGCWLFGDRDTRHQVRHDPTDPNLPLENVWYGIATLPSGVRVPCRSTAGLFADGQGYVNFGIPMVALGLAYPVGGYPFGGQHTEEWQAPLDGWLRELGASVFAMQPFRFANIGHEGLTAPYWEIDAIIASPPVERGSGYLIPDGEHIRWYPPTIMIGS